MRSDGRTLGRARPLTIGLGAVSTALGSCLAKLGSTTVLAGLRAHIGECPEGSPKEGVFKINVELAPFALSDTRSGPAQDLLAKLTQRLQATLSPLQLAKQLGISDGKAAFHAQLDAYVLDADGAAFDALLLASVATLLSARLPAVKEDENGKVRVAKRQETGEQPGKRLELRHVPVSVTCALVGGKYLLLDPTSDEERISDSSVCVVLDQHSKLHGTRGSTHTHTHTHTQAHERTHAVRASLCRKCALHPPSHV